MSEFVIPPWLMALSLKIHYHVNCGILLFVINKSVASFDTNAAVCCDVTGTILFLKEGNISMVRFGTQLSKWLKYTFTWLLPFTCTYIICECAHWSHEWILSPLLCGIRMVISHPYWFPSSECMVWLKTLMM